MQEANCGVDRFFQFSVDTMNYRRHTTLVVIHDQGTDMAAGPGPRVGDLQHTILKVLWSAGPSTVSDVHKTLAQDRELAYTTVATLLRRMETRGLVRHKEEGRKFVYEPVVSEEGITSS